MPNNVIEPFIKPLFSKSGHQNMPCDRSFFFRRSFFPDIFTLNWIHVLLFYWISHQLLLSLDICRPGWSYFGGYCYFTSRACASWLLAASNCSALSSSLVTVHNQEENVYIQHRHNGERSWIGLNDRSVEGSFVWTNRELDSFRFWAPKQPNDFNDQDCVHTLGIEHGYAWNDVSCNKCYNFTCFSGIRSTVLLLQFQS